MGFRPGVEVRLEARATWRKDLPGVLAVVEGEGEEEEEESSRGSGAEAGDRGGQGGGSAFRRSGAERGGPEEEEEGGGGGGRRSLGRIPILSVEGTDGRARRDIRWGVLSSPLSSIPSRQEPSNQWIHVILSMA